MQIHACVAEPELLHGRAMCAAFQARARGVNITQRTPHYCNLQSVRTIVLRVPLYHSCVAVYRSLHVALHRRPSSVPACQNLTLRSTSC
jgi:hypothetical protein